MHVRTCYKNMFSKTATFETTQLWLFPIPLLIYGYHNYVPNAVIIIINAYMYLCRYTYRILENRIFYFIKEN